MPPLARAEGAAVTGWRAQAAVDAVLLPERGGGRHAHLGGVVQRGCLFDDESGAGRTLGASTYSFGNCLVRCKLAHLARLCNCTPFFYPADGQRQCGLLDVTCLAKNRRTFNNLSPQSRVPGLEASEGMSCDCQPACTDVVYNAELTQGLFFKSEYDRTHFFSEVEINNHSILHVFFKDLSSIRFRRDVIYSWNDLVVESCSTFILICVVSHSNATSGIRDADNIEKRSYEFP
ncbi:Sodium channel protein Nach [Gryllus bimaculatus]|nr:Sodium channel protein Nach [Gryllus bimaculatus]